MKKLLFTTLTVALLITASSIAVMAQENDNFFTGMEFERMIIRDTYGRVPEGYILSQIEESFLSEDFESFFEIMSNYQLSFFHKIPISYISNDPNSRFQNEYFEFFT